MREIKFRAWDNDKKIFVSQGEIIFKDYGETSWEVTPNCLEYVGDQCHYGEPQIGRFAIEQYTGLKDKNGLEIYEGEILKNAKGEIGKVVWEEAGFYLECERKNGDLFLIPLTIGFLKNKEVIGNIHSNPELLK